MTTYPDLQSDSPSLGALARATGLNRSTIERQLRTLDKTWIERHPPTPIEARKGATTRYVLHIPTERDTVMPIEPGKPGRYATYLMKRLDCTAAEAAGVLATVRAENRRIDNLGGYLRKLPDEDLVDILEDVRAERATPAAAGDAGEWCTTHPDMQGGQTRTGLPRCPLCRQGRGQGEPDPFPA